VTTTLSFNVSSPVLGELPNVYTMSDEDAGRMLQAYTAKFAPINPNPREPLNPIQVVHMIADQLWQVLKRDTEQHFRLQAARGAVASVKSISAVLTTEETPSPESVPLIDVTK
jgi:hypothetical protein